jgi:hypothetical protein
MRDKFSAGWLRLLLIVGLLSVLLPSAEVFSQIGPGASLTVVRGSVSVKRSDGTAVYPAGTGLTLAIGDVVGTLERTRAIVTFFSGSEVELGSNTTIVIRRLDRDLLDSANVTVEHLSGLTLIRVNDGQPVRVLTDDTVAVVRRGEAGHGVDPNTNNITVVCVDSGTKCSPNGVAFPLETAFLPGASVRVQTGRGDLIDFRGASGTSVWDQLAEGGSIGQSEGTEGNQGSQNSRSRNEDDSQPNTNQTPSDQLASTPSPTTTPGTTSTAIATSTTTAVPSASITPTSTITPTATITRTPTVTATATRQPTATPPAGVTGPACGIQALPGVGQVTTTVHNVNRTSGTLHIDWEANAVADQFQIFYEGALIFNSGFVSNTGSANVPFGPGISTFVQVVVTGSTPVSVWDYTLGCLP